MPPDKTKATPSASQPPRSRASKTSEDARTSNDSQGQTRQGKEANKATVISASAIKPSRYSGKQRPVTSPQAAAQSVSAGQGKGSSQKRPNTTGPVMLHTSELRTRNPLTALQETESKETLISVFMKPEEDQHPN